MKIIRCAVKKDFWEEKLSLGGRRWKKRKGDNGLSEKISKLFDLPELIARILVSRQIDETGVETFLSPKLKTDLPDPSLLKDVDKGTERLKKAIEANEKILIFGDYDVDGTTSATLLYQWLKEIGIKERPMVIIPEREDGYGLDESLVGTLKDKGISLLILVDSGTTAFETIDAANTLGIDTIIIDHHEPAETLPEAFALINPKRKDQENKESLRIMAAVGVVFLFVIAVSRQLRNGGWFAKNNIAEPDLRKYLDLVALGTVCDVMPLVGINRLFVKANLSGLYQSENKGMKALAKTIDTPLSTYHYGFIFGPKINAGGRMGAAFLGFNLLSAETEEDAEKALLKLEELNTRRKEIEQQVLREAIIQAEEQKHQPILVVKKENWYHGVIGIVAGRLREKYNLPACVITLQNGMAKGSGRSTPNIDLGNAIMTAAKEGFLEKGGGHAMAAGFTVEEGKLPHFETFLLNHIKENLKGEDQEDETLWIDSLLSLSGIGMDLQKQLNVLEPFGEGNEEPVFAVPNVYIDYPKIVGNGHIKCMVSSTDGARIKAIAFRANNSKVGNLLLDSKGAPVDLAVKIKVERYNGKSSLQLMVLDASLSSIV